MALAGPKRKPAGVMPVPVWMLAGTWKVEAEGVNTPNADCVGLPKAGWAGVEAGIGDTTAELPKTEELLKHGLRAGWRAACLCPPGAPNTGWGVTPRDCGKSGFELDPKEAVSAEVGLEMPDDNVGWLEVTRAEGDRGMTLPLKWAAVSLGDSWTELGKTWLKMLPTFTMGMVESWGAGKVKPLTGLEKLALKAWEAPKGKV